MVSARLFAAAAQPMARNPGNSFLLGSNVMKSPDLNTILFNAGGGLIALVVGGYVVTSAFSAKQVPSCGERYKHAQHFALENSKGEPLTSIELQARAGGREWGVLKNTKVYKTSDAPLGRALEVTLAATGNEDAPDQNGVGFSWIVNNLSKANSACLSYGAYIPDGFKFAEAGYMPGLFGGPDLAVLDQVTPVNGFVSRMGWVMGGELGTEIRTSATAGMWLGAPHTRWPTGRWVQIEQEVKLDTPGKADGIVRIWVDGSLRAEAVNLDIRNSGQFALTGVVSDIGYAHSTAHPVAIKVSQFIVRMQ